MFFQISPGGTMGQGQKITIVDLGPGYAGKIDMRESLYKVTGLLDVQKRMLEHLGTMTYRDLVATSLRRHLKFKEAFVLMCYALRASNGRLASSVLSGLESFGAEGDRLAARELLSSYAMKEAWDRITPFEIAGMVTATMMDVMRFPDYGDRVIETCGMGGDRGVKLNGEEIPRKTINGSTLSALVLASLGVKTAKHGSYGNTSPVGSTNAIEELGVRVDIPDVDVQLILAEQAFHFTDAHAWKTVHDLSHLQPRRETINHVIGPMTPPIKARTRLDKILGVNDKLHPSIVAEAYQILNEMGVFSVGNAAIVAGLGARPTEDGMIENRNWLRDNIVLDELSPIASAVAFVQHGRSVGTHLVTPGRFGVKFHHPHAPFIKNDHDVIMQANHDVLQGVLDERQLVDLLAMNAALGLYLVEMMDDDVSLSEKGPDQDALKSCFTRCHEQIVSGRVVAYLEKYAQLTQQLSLGVAK